MVTCKLCNGSGIYTYQDGDHEHDLDCTGCNGTGEVPGLDNCPACNGKGGDFPLDGSPWEDCGVCKGTGIYKKLELSDPNDNPFKPPEFRPAPFDTMVAKHTDTVPFEQKTIYTRAVNLWGEPTQIKIAIEECAELIVKLAKLDRFKNGCEIKDVVEEIADVEIMMEQLRYIFGDTAVQQAKVQKLLRLNERVKYGEGTA